MLVHEVAKMAWIKALSCKVINHHLLSHGKETVRSSHHLFHFLLHLLLNEKRLSISKSLWIWSHSSCLEIRSHLSWHLLQYFLSQSIWIVLEVSKWHELHDISGAVLFQHVTIKRIVVSIKLLHLSEVSLTDSDDDD